MDSARVVLGLLTMSWKYEVWIGALLNKQADDVRARDDGCGDHKRCVISMFGAGESRMSACGEVCIEVSAEFCEDFYGRYVALQDCIVNGADS